jgi:hypothetical protein
LRRKRIKFGALSVKPEALVSILLHDRNSGFHLTFKKSAAYQLMPFVSIRMMMMMMMIYLTATGLTPGGSSAVHIYTQTIQRITQ